MFLLFEHAGLHPSNGQAFAHTIINSAGRKVAGPESGAFHQALQRITDESTSLVDFNRRVAQLMDDWQVPAGVRPQFPVRSASNL